MTVGSSQNECQFFFSSVDSSTFPASFKRQIVFYNRNESMLIFSSFLHDLLGDHEATFFAKL